MNTRPFISSAFPAFILALSAASLLLAGCSGPARQTEPIRATVASVEDRPRGQIPAEWLQPPSEPFTLGPGDRVEISVAGEPESEVVTVVGPDGKLYYQMLPGLDVWGLTLSEARQAIEGRLSEFYQDDPTVNIGLMEVGSKRVWMLGRLSSPGVYPLVGPMTLLDAIAQAGGPAPSQTSATLSNGGTATFSNGNLDAGDLSQAFVVREGKPLPVDLGKLLNEGDLSQNIYLQPDDLVYLPSARSREIFVLGAVARAQALPYSGRSTLISAVASAGGTVPDAYLSNVAVVRGSINEPQLAVYDYRAIISGQAPDVLLEPHDIVYVPYYPERFLRRYLDLIVTTFVRTVGVNAGARAADVDTDIGISVPIGP